MPFFDRFVESAQIQSLQIAQPSVNDTQAVSAGRAGEVTALDQDRPQSAPSRLQRNHDAVDTAADDDEIEASFGKIAGCTFVEHSRILLTLMGPLDWREIESFALTMDLLIAYPRRLKKYRQF